MQNPDVSFYFPKRFFSGCFCEVMLINNSFEQFCTALKCINYIQKEFNHTLSRFDLRSRVGEY